MGLKHQAAAARKWHTAIRRIQAHFPAHLPPLLFLTDPDRVPDPVAVISDLPYECGVIYRHFGADNRRETAAKLSEACRVEGRVFLVAADPVLALAVRADGVHWPERRLGEARRWRGKFPLQTSSAHSQRAIFRAQTAGMDAALVSTVYHSKSPSATYPMGASRFNALARKTGLPLYGLGGLTAQNSGRIANDGGIAAIEGLLPTRRD